MSLDNYRKFSVQAQKSFYQLDSFQEEIQTFASQFSGKMDPETEEKVNSILIPVQNFLRTIDEGKSTLQDLNKILEEIDNDGQAQNFTDSLHELEKILMNQKETLDSEMEKIKSAMKSHGHELP